VPLGAEATPAVAALHSEPPVCAESVAQAVSWPRRGSSAAIYVSVRAATVSGDSGKHLRPDSDVNELIRERQVLHVIDPRSTP